MKKRTKEEAIEKDPVVLKNARRSCLKLFRSICRRELCRARSRKSSPSAV